MGSVADIKAWLVTRSAALITGTVPASISAYAGQQDRAAGAAFEVQVKYVATIPARRANQHDRHELDLIVKARGNDVTDDDTLSDAVDDALRELEAGIDANHVEANASMSDVHVERVRAFRAGPMEFATARYDRRATLRVEVDELKGGV